MWISHEFSFEFSFEFSIWVFRFFLRLSHFRFKWRPPFETERSKRFETIQSNGTHLQALYRVWLRRDSLWIWFKFSALWLNFWNETDAEPILEKRSLVWRPELDESNLNFELENFNETISWTISQWFQCWLNDQREIEAIASEVSEFSCFFEFDEALKPLPRQFETALYREPL